VDIVSGSYAFRERKSEAPDALTLAFSFNDIAKFFGPKCGFLVERLQGNLPIIRKRKFDIFFV
jgi:hypothetical protein